MRDVLLIVDVLQDFSHDDGTALLESLRRRRPQISQALSRARASVTPVVYANDNAGVWDSDMWRLVDRALAGDGRDVIAPLVPEQGDRFVVKPRYSAFDHTPLALILEELGCERLFVAGASTEGCVTQSAIDARELGYRVSVVARACATTDPALEQTALRYLTDVVGVRLADPDEIGRPVASA
jgi:nicotinamidase-related amidase